MENTKKNLMENTKYMYMYFKKVILYRKVTNANIRHIFFGKFQTFLKDSTAFVYGLQTL